MNERGADLYRLVREYAALAAHHRTGTAADEATLVWFTEALRRRGAAVERVPYAFQRFAGRCRLTAGGAEVPTLPLYYEATGQVETDRLFVGEVPVDFAAAPPRFDAALAAAARSGADAAVLATVGATRDLVAPNRAPELGGSLPAVLVPGAELPRLRTNPLRLRYEAHLEPAHSATVVGRLGDGTGNPILLATSLSGWFRCAGERGTGIALLLHLADALAAHHPVLVVATTGHELRHLGLRRFMDDRPVRAAAVVHLGASLAAGVPEDGGALRLAPTRWVLTTASDRERLRKPLAGARLAVASPQEPWVGEGAAWRRLGVPVLSLVGYFSLFHTARDLPEAATSPELLATAYEAVQEAVSRFLEEAGSAVGAAAFPQP